MDAIRLPKPVCPCIDCGGSEPDHSKDCDYMNDLHGTVRHNVGSDGLSDEDRAQMEAESAAYHDAHGGGGFDEYEECEACNDLIAECSCPHSAT